MGTIIASNLLSHKGTIIVQNLLISLRSNDYCKQFSARPYFYSRSAWSPRPPSLFEAKSQLASSPTEFTFALTCKQQAFLQKKYACASTD